MTPEELRIRFLDFYDEVSEDPVWLIGCMQDAKYNLHSNKDLTLLVFLYAYDEGCIQETSGKHYHNFHDELTQWLIDMHNAEEGVTFSDIRNQSHCEAIIDHIKQSWRTWLIGQISGRYFDPKYVWCNIDCAVLDNPHDEPEALCHAS